MFGRKGRGGGIMSWLLSHVVVVAVKIDNSSVFSVTTLSVFVFVY